MSKITKKSQGQKKGVLFHEILRQELANWCACQKRMELWQTQRCEKNIRAIVDWMSVSPQFCDVSRFAKLLHKGEVATKKIRRDMLQILSSREVLPLEIQSIHIKANEIVNAFARYNLATRSSKRKVKAGAPEKNLSSILLISWIYLFVKDILRSSQVKEILYETSSILTNVNKRSPKIKLGQSKSTIKSTFRLFLGVFSPQILRQYPKYNPTIGGLAYSIYEISHSDQSLFLDRSHCEAIADLLMNTHANKIPELSGIEESQELTIFNSGVGWNHEYDDIGGVEDSPTESADSKNLELLHRCRAQMRRLTQENRRLRLAIKS